MFSLLSDYTFQIVAIGAGLLGGLAGASGSFAVIKKNSLLGDGIAHASLAGITLSFLLTNTRNQQTLLIGAVIFGLIATFIIYFFTKKTSINYESSIALVMSSFFGLGLCLLTQIQKQPNSNQAGLDRYLFGQCATILRKDVEILFVAFIVILILMMLFFKELKLYIFDPIYCKSLGFKTSFLEFLISSFIVISVILGIQMVGVVLMSALLISPAVAARQWSHHFKGMFILSMIFGAFSGILGTMMSSILHRFPTGPAIVVCSTLLVIISLGFAPGRGLIERHFRIKHAKMDASALMMLIHIFTHHHLPTDSVLSNQQLVALIQDDHQLSKKQINLIIESLLKNGHLVKHTNQGFYLTLQSQQMILSYQEVHHGSSTN